MAKAKPPNPIMAKRMSASVERRKKIYGDRKGIVCPKCSEFSNVRQTFLMENQTILRKRRCLNKTCYHVWATVERSVTEAENLRTQKLIETFSDRIAGKITDAVKADRFR